LKWQHNSSGDHTQATLPGGAKPTKLETTVDVEYPGIGRKTPFLDLTFGPVNVAKSEFGGYEASATLTNPTSEPMKNPRIGAVCLDSAGAIIGGGSAFPNLVPPSGQVLVKTNLLIVSGTPASCEMRGGAPLC
jgi:hypothetical protein